MKTRKKKTSSKNSEIIENICKTSGICLLFGHKKDTIKNFFEFNSFKYLASPVKAIGNPSKSGFVKELHYLKNNYNSYAVLKSAADLSMGDNLAYEYIVGQFINKLNNFYPCFIETYGIFHYKTMNTYDYSYSNKTIDPTIFPKLLKNIAVNKYNINLAFACNEVTSIAILIQSIQNILQIRKLIKKDTIAKNYNFVKKHLIYVLYQIYLPLSMMRNIFTHYDLHQDNILIYYLGMYKYIKMHYHYANKTTISFNTCYIPKIIDYGRCYFNDKHENISTKDVFNKVCEIKECDPNCGTDYGFGNITNVPKINRLSAYKKNISQDLEYLNIIKNMIPTFPKYSDFDYFNKILTLIKKTTITRVDPTAYWLVENKQMGYPDNIYNIVDAQKLLEDLILDPESISLNQTSFNEKYTKLGDLHIYTDGHKKMEFIPNV